MGIDITTFVEARRDGVWELVFEDRNEELFWRNYSIFGFLADVRNYSHSPVIAEARWLPDDVSAELRLVKSVTTTTGVIIATYEPA